MALNISKIFSLLLWKNKPDKTTAINADNLNKLSNAINSLDDEAVKIGAQVDLNTKAIEDDGKNIIEESKRASTAEKNNSDSIAENSKSISSLEEQTESIPVIENLKGLVFYTADDGGLNCKITDQS